MYVCMSALLSRKSYRPFCEVGAGGVLMCWGDGGVMVEMCVVIDVGVGGMRAGTARERSVGGGLRDCGSSDD